MDCGLWDVAIVLFELKMLNTLANLALLVCAWLHTCIFIADLHPRKNACAFVEFGLLDFAKKEEEKV